MAIRQRRTEVDAYITRVFAPEDALLKRVRAVGESLVPGMQVSAQEGKLLHCLLRMVKAQRVLEFGSFVGYSTLWMARALESGGELISLEKNPLHAQHARVHAVASGLPIDIREGDALEQVQGVEGPFDAVFLDGEKRRYMDYLEAALPMLRPGGLMIADNSLLFGALTGTAQQHVSQEAIEVMNAVNARLADSEEFVGIMLPTTEGMSVGIRR